MIYWPPKAPGEVADFTFDFTDALEAAETLSTQVVTPTGVIKNSAGIVAINSVASKGVQVWLAGGTLGTPGTVTCVVTTSLGRTYVATAILAIGEEPVSLAMARSQTRSEGQADDDYLLDLVQSAREHAEAYCGIRLMPASVEMTFASFAELERLSQAPVRSIAEVRYLDPTGVEQVLDPSIYELLNVDADPLRPRLRLAYGKSFPSTRSAEDAVRVSALVGYTVVPKPVIRAMLLLVGQWYDNREPIASGSIAELPNSVTALLSNFRR